MAGRKSFAPGAATMSSETPPSRSRGVRSSRTLVTARRGKHLTHRQRNAGVDRYGPFPQHGGEAAGPRPEAVDQEAPEQAETRPGGDALPEHEGRSEQPRHRRPDAEDGPASGRDDDGGAPQLLLRHLPLRPQASVSSCRLSSRVRQRMWSQGIRIVLPWGHDELGVAGDADQDGVARGWGCP